MGPAVSALIELIGEELSPVTLIVHVLDERVFDRHAPTVCEEVLTSRIEEFTDFPP